MKGQLLLLLKTNYSVFKALRFFLVALGYYRRRLKTKLDATWQHRINVVIGSPDNRSFAKVDDAGEIKRDFQLMHNGIKVHVGSYYGNGMTHLLHQNKGVHEPQEEKAFETILKFLPQDAVMLELGAFWAFYSLWFSKRIPSGRNFLIEPDAHALLSGKHNFTLNGSTGQFFKYYIADQPAPGPVSTTTVDQFMLAHQLSKLHILHSDIQGFELKMLEGAQHALRERQIDYIFISTHSEDLHRGCIRYLQAMGYSLLCDANLAQSFSEDGLIVAKSPKIKEPDKLEISLRG